MNIRKNTYGLNFPFSDGSNGDFLKLTETPELEIKSNLIHLLLTKKGSRYYLPDFGTNLYQYIFEPLDDITLGKIEDEILDAVEKYIPNLTIDKINIEKFYDQILAIERDDLNHKIKIKLDYTINSRTFQSSGVVTLLL
jgi:phage baseplate assembly protein W